MFFTNISVHIFGKTHLGSDLFLSNSLGYYDMRTLLYKTLTYKYFQLSVTIERKYLFLKQTIYLETISYYAFLIYVSSHRCYIHI